MAINNGGRTFVREDWLAKLGIAPPKTRAEFEAMLYAFRDNAATLLGEENADKMIPMTLGQQIGWGLRDLVFSYVPEDFSDRDTYLYRKGDELFLIPETKEAYRLVNKWYNDKLIWQDFPLSTTGDTGAKDLIKAGYVGSYMQNWDTPWRDGEEGEQLNMQNQVGPEAAFIPVGTFENEAGLHRYYMGAATDRNIFFPMTNEEPVASLLYLNWITDIDNSVYLQVGDDGVNHTAMPDGSVQMIQATGADIMNSVNNIDYTMTINGLRLPTEEALVASIGYNYPGIDPKYVAMGFDQSYLDIKHAKNLNCGPIAAEVGIETALNEKRDIFLVNAVVAAPDQFDAVYDAGMADYMSSGGQAILDERIAAWSATYGDVENID
jgi:putative aldouronate transport system substrate-binding protein